MRAGPWQDSRIERTAIDSGFTRRTWRTTRFQNAGDPASLLQQVYASHDQTIDRVSTTYSSDWDRVVLNTFSFSVGSNYAADVAGAAQLYTMRQGIPVPSSAVAAQTLSIAAFSEQRLTYPQIYPDFWPPDAIDIEFEAGGTWIGDISVRAAWQAAVSSYSSQTLSSRGRLILARSTVPTSYSEVVALLDQAGLGSVDAAYANDVSFRSGQLESAESWAEFTVAPDLPFVLAVSAGRAPVQLTEQTDDTVALAVRGAKIVDVEATRLYQGPRFRFLFDEPVVTTKGAWGLRQKQVLAGNAGGWPLRQRQNGGATGTWPLRQRQTGV